MAGFARIDTSLPQRSSLLRLFKKLEREDLSLDDMEKIARQVQQVGRHAIPPLMRRVRKVTTGTVLARYMYLLDLFDEESWLDDLVRITLVRTDLGIDAKTVLLAVLERCGIDIEQLPFSRLLKEVGGCSATGLDGVLAGGEADFVPFLEDFVCFSSDSQVALIRRLATMEQPAAVSLLEILLGFSDAELVREVLISLGTVRRQSAASILLRFLRYGDGTFRSLAERSLRRLSFLGIDPEQTAAELPDSSPHLAALSPIDGTGFRSVWFSRWNGSGGLDVLLLQTHETCGITEATGYDGLTVHGHDELFREITIEEELLRVSSDYACAILRDALYLNADSRFPIPAGFHVWRRVLQLVAITPAPYVPDFSGFDLDRIAASNLLLETGDTLFDEDYLAGWFSAKGRVFDIVDELAHLQGKATSDLSVNGFSALLKRFMREIIIPEKNRIARRLFLTADLMKSTGREREIIERTLSAALNLVNQKVPYLKNPFLRRFALESLSFARDALAEGYDPRKHESEWSDGELWD